MNSDRSNWIKLRQSDPIIINSHLRRSWRCNASAERHLFHSVHHWTKEVNFTIERIISVSVHHCNLLSGVSSMISADELTSLVERAVGCLLPKSIFAFAEVILASLPLLLLLPYGRLGFSCCMYLCNNNFLFTQSFTN